MSMSISTSQDPTQRVRLVTAKEVGNQETGQTEGMVRQAGLVDVCDKLCSSVMIAEPHSSSAIHHHGDQPTVVYALSGRGSIVFGPDSSQRHDLGPGDHALIPAMCEHQEVNDGDEQVTWIIVRSGRKPVVENLSGWGASKG